MNLPLGIRQNNPGNIVVSANPWVGKVHSDTPYEAFDTPENGLRALMVLLCNGYRNRNLKTVRKIIERYAPPHENDTEAYIKFVCARLNVTDDKFLVVSHTDTLLPLVKAIVRFENGEPPAERGPNWYADSVFDEAARRALNRR